MPVLRILSDQALHSWEAAGLGGQWVTDPWDLPTGLFCIYMTGGERLAPETPGWKM